MFNGLSDAARSVIEPILGFYRDTQFAYALAAVMAVVALALVIIAVVTHSIRVGAIQQRIRIMSSFITFRARGGGKDDADDREAQFAIRFDEIDQRLRDGRGFTEPLAYAWRRYRKTLSFIGAPPIRSTQRPNSFFYAAMTPPTWLGFAANMFVAFGLLATFLGLVAALTFASQGMTSDDVGTMQTALRELLAAASSKFVTSVAGVALSIILRLLERLLVVDLRGRLDRLSASLEFGVRVDSDANSAALAEQMARIANMMESQLSDPGPESVAGQP